MCKWSAGGLLFLLSIFYPSCVCVSDSVSGTLFCAVNLGHWGKIRYTETAAVFCVMQWVGGFCNSVVSNGMWRLPDHGGDSSTQCQCHSVVSNKWNVSVPVEGWYLIECQEHEKGSMGDQVLSRPFARLPQKRMWDPLCGAYHMVR